MKKEDLITFSIQPYDFYSSFYDSIVGLELAQRRLSHTFYASFGYVAALPPELERRDLIASELDRKGKVTREVRAWNNGLIEVRITRSPATRRCIDVWGYFYSKVDAAECLNELGKHLPKENGTRRDDSVTVNFWNVGMTHGERQPRRQSQTMQVPKWDEIASNYPGRVRSELASAMKMQESDVTASRMMLWRGLPGTGKTWAIRSLIYEWSTWCTFHYLVDTAAFFSDSNFMLSLLSMVSESGRTEEETRGKWSLIILEDAGEFIAMDARHQYGQALSKLLNLSDGMLGQGQKLLFLITTNEEVQNLHPAIVRHGRCLSNLEFPEFAESEALEWLKSHGGSSGSLSRRRTLSDLFAAIGSAPSIANVVPFKRAGFVR